MNDNYFKKIFALIVVIVLFPFSVAADTFLKCTIETNEYFYEFDNFDQTLLQNGLDEIEIISVTPIKTIWIDYCVRVKLQSRKSQRPPITHLKREGRQQSLWA